MTVHVAIVVFDGVDELDALGPYEVFSNAGAAGADLEVRLVTSDDLREVHGSHGLVFRSQGRLDGAPDVVVVPGGGWYDRAERGAWQLAQDGTLTLQLADLHRKGGTIMASVCTGGMLLAAAGILKGRRAVTHGGAVAELAAAGAHVVEERVVDDGDVVTAGGVTSGLDLALHLVERLFGAAVRTAVEDEIEYRGSPSWLAPGRAATDAVESV